MGKIGFDNALYLQQRSEEILKRAGRFDNKLYLEFGGKLAYDFHAARILPGFDPNVKLQLLQRLKDKIDVVICIYSGDIEGELCTPTGAALLRHFATRFGQMPLMSVSAIGYGMGRKDFPAANCVR